MEHKKIKVLMVDDDRDYFIFIQRMFEATDRRHFDFSWAPSYEVAVGELNNPYDVALLDFRLGGYTGMDVLREAKKNRLYLSHHHHDRHGRSFPG